MRIIVTYGIKYEPQWLVDEMRENLSWCDGFAEVDCRSRTHEMWIDEREYRQLQREACAKLDADWVLVTSPDERWEKSAEMFIRKVVEMNRRRIYYFPLREMWSPNEYRVDGIWGRKTRPRLYPFLPGQRMTRKPIQSAPVPIDKGYKRRLLRQVNLYHLKMIEPESRRSRALAYEALDPNYRWGKKERSKLARIDPEGKFNDLGYHYLYDETGLRLETIPEGRGFEPAYTRRYVFRMPKQCEGCSAWAMQVGIDMQHRVLCEACWSVAVA